MQNFTWYTPTRVIFGTGILNRLGKETSKFGTRALFLYGRQSIKQSGLYDTVIAQLRAAGIAFEEHGGVQPNPILNHALEGAKKCGNMGSK